MLVCAGLDDGLPVCFILLIKLSPIRPVVFLLVIGAVYFGTVVEQIGGPDRLTCVGDGANGGQWRALIAPPRRHAHRTTAGLGLGGSEGACRLWETG